jgi:hypothetical protein
MNEIDSLLGVESTPVELKDIVGTNLPSISLPQAAIRNRASTVALLSEDPAKAVDNYQVMMAEGESGSDTIVKSQQERILSQAEQDDTKNFMTVLSDPSIPMERKQAVIKNMYNNPVRKDVTTKLMTDSLAKESAGETIEAEDARIGATSRAINEIYRAREEIQGLVNAHGASLGQGGTARAVGEIASSWVAPLSQNILMATLTQNKPGATLWDAVKALALPGSAKEKMFNELKNLPPAERVKASKEFLDLISKNSQTLFANNNQFAQYELARDAFNEGSYTSFDKWLDNITGVLDIVGLGAVGRVPRGVAKLEAEANAASKGVGAPQSVQPAVEASRGLPAGITTGDLAKVEAKPTRGVFDGRIASLEEQKAKLLGEGGNMLDNGQVASLTQERKQIASTLPDVKALAKDIQAEQGVTSKEAKKRAESIFAERSTEVQSTLARIDSQLETNRNASTVTQKIADIEKEIALLQKRNTEVFIPKNPLADAISRIELNAPVRMANPASPIEVIKLANPQQARNMHELLVKSADDSVAEGIAGTSRMQAIVNNVFPQVTTPSGRVAAQPVDIERNLRREMQVPDSIYKAIWDDGGIMYTPQEKAVAKANLVRDFQKAEGLVMRQNMGGFHDDGLRFNISAVYGTPEGDFKNARQAFEQAKYALRQQGVLDDEIEILSKEGLDYVPVKLADVGESEGSYLVRVNTKHEIDPTDVVSFEQSKVKLNFLDRLPGTQWGQHGNASRYLFDASSMLDPKYTGAASVATDRAAGFEKLMLDVATRYSDIYTKLSKDAKVRVDSYLLEANYNQLAFDAGDLRKRGMQADEIQAVKEWRHFWDGHFYLENLDMVRTLNSQGYSMFKNANAELFAKPVSKNSSIGKVYDPATDTIVTLSQKELDDLYNTNGTYARLRRPTDFGGTVVEHMIVRNTPTEYLRKIRDNDRVLNYREGYFQLQYNAPRFVDEISVGANGEKIRKAVAVAGDTPEAKRFAERMNANAPPGVVYIDRADERALRRGSDDWFDVNSASGRIAQRHRGKLLEDAAGMNHLGDGSYILDPVTSAIRAARSISGRTVTRPMLEASKARFMEQYKHLLPSDGMGGVRMPNSVGEIGEKGKVLGSEVADARTVFNNIHYLENGYINGLDSVWKQFFYSLAEKAGDKGLGKSQRALLGTGEIAPAQLGKESVFMATIGTNPLRQWIVQAHQGTRMIAYNPIGWMNGQIPYLFAGFMESRISGRPISKEMAKFVDFVESSGMMAAVDKQNLVRGTLVDAADSSNKAVRMAVAGPNLLRKIGFDTSEMANTLVHLAAVYEREVRAGKDLTNKALRDEAYSTTRAVSWDMNFAGDMPYNQTAPSLILQFMQVPHKAFLQLLNRRIPVGDRARLIGGDIIFWGPPTLLVSEMMGGDILPENKDLRELFTYGAESLLLNKAFQTLLKDDSINIDWSSLAPYDMHGWAQILHGFYTGGIQKAIANSPAGQMFLSDGGRVQQALGSALRFFGMSEPIGETPDSYLHVINEVMKISSGWSNATKAYIALEAGKRQDKYGRPVADSVHNAEAIMLAFGFNDASQRDNWKLIEKSNKMTKSFKDDVLKDYKNILQYYQSEMGKGVQSVEQMTAVTSFVLKRYEGNPEALEIIQRQLALDLTDPNSKLLYQIMKASGLPEAEKLKDSIRMANIPDDQKKLVLDRLDDIQALK